MHAKTRTKKQELKAVERRLVGYGSNTKSYRAFDPATGRIMGGRKFAFIETPYRLLPPPSEGAPSQMRRWNNEVDDHYYTTDGDFLRSLHDYTSALGRLLGAFAECITTGGLPTNPEVAEPFERIGEVTRMGVLHNGASVKTLEGAWSGGALPEGYPQETILLPLDQPASPGGAPLVAPLAG